MQPGSSWIALAWRCWSARRCRRAAAPKVVWLLRSEEVDDALHADGHQGVDLRRPRHRLVAGARVAADGGFVLGSMSQIYCAPTLARYRRRRNHDEKAPPQRHEAALVGRRLAG